MKKGAEFTIITRCMNKEVYMNLIQKCLTTALIFFSITSLAQDQIHFGVSSFYPPYVYNSEPGYINGLDIEVAQAICKKTGKKCLFTQLPLSQLSENLNKNKVDAIIGAIVVTPDKKLLFSFSKPYFKTTSSFITLNTSSLNPTLEAMQNSKIGVIKDSVYYTYIYSHFPKVQLISFDTAEQLITAVVNKKIDATLLDTPAANYWVGYNKGQLKKMGNDFNIPGNEGFGIVVKKGNVKLLNEINQSLDSLNSNNRLHNIIYNYLLKKS